MCTKNQKWSLRFFEECPLNRGFPLNRCPLNRASTVLTKFLLFHDIHDWIFSDDSYHSASASPQEEPSRPLVNHRYVPPARVLPPTGVFDFDADNAADPSGLATNSIFYFLFPFCTKSLICLEGPHWGNTYLFRSFQQLYFLCLGSLKGFLSHGTLQGPSAHLVRCFWNYREKQGTLPGVLL